MSAEPLYAYLHRRTHETIEKAADDDRLSHVVDISLALLIILNILALMLETVDWIHANYGDALRVFDVLSLVLFTAEYMSRIWSCTADPAFSHPIRGRLRYAAQPMMLLDLLVILPFYLPKVAPSVDLRFARALRLLRLVRIIRIGRYSASLQTLGSVFVRKKEELVIAFFAEIVLLIVTSSVLYFVETGAQPDVFSSIPTSMWWGMSTLTTVGYGDIVPITAWGRTLAMAISLIGIAMFALPVGILGAGFIEEREETETRRRTGQMENPRERGYVLFNFPGVARFGALVQEIRHIEADVPICVVDDTLDELPPNAAALPNVHFIRASILDRRTYDQARLRDNQVVIVFPRESGVPESDGTTRTVVDLVSRYVGDETRILHVLVSAENAWMFEGINSTAVIGSLQVLALVQESQDRHSSSIVQRLLLNTEGGNPNTVSPTRTVGWSWAEFSRCCLEAAAQSGVMANPLAIVKRTGPFLCPPASELIEEGNEVSIIALPGFDWDAFEQVMVECRAAAASA
jgi:voltage-gated potassium channel